MAKILGLDLGTNSIGWAVVESENNIFSITKDEDGNKKCGVLVFQEGVKNEKGTEKSRVAERTGYRSARRLKFRRKIRKYQTLLVLAENGMCPLTEEEAKAWRKSGFKKYPDKKEFLEWLRTDSFGEKNNKEHKAIRRKQNSNPYFFRDKASREKIGKLELGRAFYHIAQRRGFLSNRLDQSDKGAIEKHQPDLEDIISDAANLVELSGTIEDFLVQLDIDKSSKELNEGDKKVKTLFNAFRKIIKGKSDTEAVKKELLARLYRKENLGAVKQGISDLDYSIEQSGCQTLGQYFWKIYQQSRGLEENKIRSNYTAREDHYLQEFEIICQVQKLEGINKTKKDPSLRYSGIVRDLYRAIFYQRPLKSQKGLVGKCSFEKTKARCPVSRPEYEEYRMYAFINNIKIKTATDENLRSLTEDERNRIVPKFYRKSKPTFAFSDLAKALGNENQYNFKDNTTVSGCPIIAALSNVFGDGWKQVIYQAYPDKDIRNRKTKERIRTKTEDEVIADIWHVLNTFTSSDKLEEFAAEKLGLDKPAAEKFSKINLKQDYASLSLNAINKILPYLKSGLIYSHAVFMANMQNIVDVKRWAKKEDRELIQSEIKRIIDEHQTENKIRFVINSLLKNCKDNGYHYSTKAENGFHEDLNKSFENEFGKNTWSEKDDKETILSDAFEVFKKHLKANTFISIKRIDEKILVFLDDNDLLKNANKLYHPSDIEKFTPERIKDKNGNEILVLGSPITGSIKNPMAMRALHQLRKVVNTLILDGVVDEHTKINIELARGLNDANKRKAIKKWQDDREELRKVYEAKIKELYSKETGNEINPTNGDVEKFQMALEQRKDGLIISKDEILKYQLWDEQNHICLYTGNTIGLTEFIGSNPNYDIEHTIPRSVSLDNSQMNKTLCENKFNREVKKGSIPFDLQMDDEILPRIKHWKKRYEALNDDIEDLKRATRGATEKEHKDRLIQKRHYLQMEYRYWKGKHDRFTLKEVKQGFKNSQIVDTGIITKYAVGYMKSLFNKVYSIKGEMVDQYRKTWGLHEKERDENGKVVVDNNGFSVLKKKDRSNHIHHCVDAITIACMDKVKYDKLAHAWGLEDKGDYHKAKKELEQMKPWKAFTEDVKNLKNEVLVVHHSKDVLPKQTKKKLRKRGVIQRDKNGNVIYQQGDTVRGSLHKDTFYGAIAKDKEGKINYDKEGNIIPNYVVRKELSKLKKTDVENIVDKNVREIVEQADKDGIISFNNNGAKVDKEKGVWQNKEKQIPLKKVRVHVPLKNPLKDFKKHSNPFLSKKEYKQQFNVDNEENHCMAIYEGLDKKGTVKRASELVNNIVAGEYYKLSNKEDRENQDLVPNPHLKTGFPLKYILKKGTMVLMYDKSPEEIWELSHEERLERLFEITQLDVENSGIKLLHHQEAREKKEIKTHMGLKIKGGKNIGKHKEYPLIKVGANSFDALVEGYEFKITPTGKIEKL